MKASTIKETIYDYYKSGEPAGEITGYVRAYHCYEWVRKMADVHAELIKCTEELCRCVTHNFTWRYYSVRKGKWGVTDRYGDKKAYTYNDDMLKHREKCNRVDMHDDIWEIRYVIDYNKRFAPVYLNTHKIKQKKRYRISLESQRLPRLIHPWKGMINSITGEWEKVYI